MFFLRECPRPSQAPVLDLDGRYQFNSLLNIFDCLIEIFQFLFSSTPRTEMVAEVVEIYSSIKVAGRHQVDSVLTILDRGI